MLKKIVIGIVLIGVALAIKAFWLEPASIRISTYEEPVAAWPPECDGLRIAVLADLHIGSPYNGLDRLTEIVALTNATEPDLILLAGDYVIDDVVGGTFVSPEDAAIELSNLKARLGAFAVLGNHDWWLDAKRVADALLDAGVTVLEDRNTLVSNDKCRFTLAGISDYWEGAHDIDKALAGRDPELPVLAFSHNPDLIPQLPDDIAFFIAGHTHGGQVNLPFVGRLVVPSEFGQRYAAGSIRDGAQRAFVSTGIGTSIFPVRFHVPPEISLVLLQSD